MPDLAWTIAVRAKDDGASMLMRGIAGVATTMVSGAATLAAGATKAVVDFGVQSVNMAGQYQQSMNMVQGLTGTSASQMRQYDASLKQLAVDAGVAPDALSKGLYNVISAGYSGQTAMSVLTLATKDAKIGMTDAATTSNALTIALKAFNVPADQFNAVNGQMLRTVTAGKMSMSDYAASIAKTSSVAVQYNDTMSNMNAVISTLTANGIKNAVVAGTDYNNLLKVLNGNTDSVIAKSQALNPAFDGNAFRAMDMADKVNYLNTMIIQHGHNITEVIGRQQNAAAAFTVLSTHASEYAANLKNLSDQQANAAATQNAWSITQSGFEQQLSRLRASFQVLMIDLGSAFLPILTQLISNIMPVVESMTQWVTQNHIADQIATALGHAVTFLWNGFQSMLPTLRLFFQQVGVILTQFADWITKNNVLGQAMHVVMQVGQLLWETLRTAMPVLGNLFLQIMPIISGLLQWAINNNVLGNAITAIGGVLTLLLQAISVILPPLLNAITGFINWITQTGILQGALSLASQGVQGLGNWISQTIPGLKQWGSAADIAANSAKNLGAHGNVVAGGGGPTGPGKTGTSGPGMSQTSNIMKPQDLTLLQQIGQFLSSTFLPVWQGISSTFNSMVVPAWNNMLKAIQPLRPELALLGAFLATTVLGIFDMIVRVGATPLVFVGTLVVGLIAAATNFGQIFTASLAAVVDIAKGDWAKLKRDLDIFNAGWQKVIQGLWDAVKNAFQTSGDYVMHIVDNWGHDILKIFNWLYNQLVGNSIVPDTVKGIVQWFTNMGPMALQAVTNGLNSIVNKFNSFLSQATQFGKNVVQNVINGIQSMMGNLGQAAATIASTIKSYLPHSPAERGPLQNVDRFMPSFISMLSSQLNAGVPSIAASTSALVTPLSGLAAPLQGTAPRGGSGGGHVFNITVQVDGRSQKTDTDLVNMVSDKLGKQLLKSGLMLPTVKGL